MATDDFHKKFERAYIKKMSGIFQDIVLYESFINKDNLFHKVKYHKKVELPLNEFAEFYLKSDKVKGTLEERSVLAYNDALSKYATLLSRGDFSGRINEEKFDTMSEYVTKIFFSKYLSKEYENSKKSPEEIFEDYCTSWFKELFKNAKITWSAKYTE